MHLISESFWESFGKQVLQTTSDNIISEFWANKTSMPYFTASYFSSFRILHTALEY